jgi:hypothetical protein
VTQQNHRITREWRPGNEDKLYRKPIFKRKTELVLKSLLLINESIMDAESLQAYEGLAKQIGQIHWEICNLLFMNQYTDKELETAEEVLDGLGCYGDCFFDMAL